MKSKSPLVSVVMLNYNGLKYLKRTITPILKLDYPNYEFIIVDNGSTDGSIEFIKKFKKIKLIENKENLGYSKGKNIGVDKAKGEYVLLLDNDILLKNSFLLIKLIQFYNELKKPAFVNVLLLNKGNMHSTNMYGSYYGFWGIINNPLILTDRISAYNKYIQTVISFGGILFFKRNTWKFLGGFDESQPFNLDDDDISLRANILGFNNYLYNKLFCVHLGEAERSSNSNFRWKYKYYFSGKAKPILKNLSPWSIALIFPLFIIKTIFKTIKQIIFRIDPLLLYSFFYSILIFLRDINRTLKERDKIQKKRKVKDKEFLFKRFPING